MKRETQNIAELKQEIFRILDSYFGERVQGEGGKLMWHGIDEHITYIPRQQGQGDVFVVFIEPNFFSVTGETQTMKIREMYDWVQDYKEEEAEEFAEGPEAFGYCPFCKEDTMLTIITEDSDNGETYKCRRCENVFTNEERRHRRYWIDELGKRKRSKPPWKQMEEEFGKIELSEYKRQSSKLDQISQKKLKKECIMNTEKHRKAQFTELTDDEKELLEAVELYNTTRIKELLDKGVNVNAREKYHAAPIHKAIEYGYIDIVKLLLDHGADIQLRDGEGRTPLYYAVRYRRADIRMDMVKLLLDYGANVYGGVGEGRTPLHDVACEGYVDAAKLLLDHGADINVQSMSGRTPLHNAASFAHPAMVKLLLNHGADVNAKNERGCTPLHNIISKYMHAEHISVIQLLLDHGADINAKDNTGDTPLHKAVRVRHTSTIRFLLDHGADPNIRNEEGKTPIDLAKEKGYVVWSSC